MKRISFEQKVETCQKYGTLKTYSFDQAVKQYEEFAHPDFDVEYLRSRYAAGKYLCSFHPNDDNEELEIVYQIGSLSFFVKEVIFELIKLELEYQKRHGK